MAECVRRSLARGNVEERRPISPHGEDGLREDSLDMKRPLYIAAPMVRYSKCVALGSLICRLCAFETAIPAPRATLLRGLGLHADDHRGQFRAVGEVPRGRVGHRQW